MQVRPARVGDVIFIEQLLRYYADRSLLLPRSRLSIIESLPCFKVVEENGELLGCGALHVLWDDLAEVRSLAIVPQAKGRGLGKMLVEAFVREAESMGIRRVMALTYQQAFFEKCGFHVVDRSTLPQKVWKDCLNCAKRFACDEIAMIRVLETVPVQPPLLEPLTLPKEFLPVEKKVPGQNTAVSGT
ncbi:MAG: N-acetyltransferase [Bacillota bacterium]|nr:GNAT family N-acetyltransferase [Bacillota bacterium]